MASLFTIIKSDLQYSNYLAELRELLGSTHEEGSEEAERISLLSVLIEKYEKERFIQEAVDPVDAITFRMAELGLRRVDLADVLGGKNRVSEILSRDRSLTVDMMRSLHERLKIPAEVLLSKPDDVGLANAAASWEHFPIKEMLKRHWISAAGVRDKDIPSALGKFFAAASMSPGAVLMRKSLRGAVSDRSRYSILAWLARISIKALEVGRNAPVFSRSSISDEFLSQLAKLSWADKGPLLAQEFLLMKGIVLVCEPHLEGTRLDGAALIDKSGRAVIGLTLRLDRVDNFWFTLMHELAHLRLHLQGSAEAFADEEHSLSPEEQVEDEADLFAGDALIPRAEWRRSDAYRLKTPRAVRELAEHLRVSPAVIAGRIRRDTGNYKILGDFVGEGKVRRLFKDQLAGAKE